METKEQFKKTHLGRKISRIREIRGIKQDALAMELGLSQQTISKIEQSEDVDDETLNKISKALGVSSDAIKNFNEEAVVNIIANTVNNHDQSASVFISPNFNPIDKIVELYERLLKSEQEKNELLNKK
ncbi:DNA-binding transcriptional regulator, XRE-family HTH domain [Pedobacter suwonensis]|uniref:DNA-binding transcriptional regulator, XRE-family HTH domain n=1 Tax=Pedobacter suwonensis TaxID=332999 RepID=A0A1I0U5N6_9SPHI|nr:helix-turn-helix transcriptional regulator [Pedobacter suwonensis]SFA58506.1 DNA-binding transcriptional regulator, XRE-family HTH domain [Pedobacter suwonensis]